MLLFGHLPDLNGYVVAIWSFLKLFFCFLLSVIAREEPRAAQSEFFCGKRTCYRDNEGSSRAINGAWGETLCVPFM